MIIFERVDKIIHVIESFLVGNFIKSNKELVFLFCLVIFPILTRVLPLTLVTIFFVICFVLYTVNHFYFYVNSVAASENKKVNISEYSWGFVREYNCNLDTSSFVNYLKNKKWDFYRAYLSSNKEYLVLLAFLFGDLVVAFKNLSLEASGAYFAMSVFTKFVFIAYLFVNSANNQVKYSTSTDEEKNEKYLDNFYKHFSGIASLGFVLFLVFFALGKFLTELFFGVRYIEYQTSLSFILLANITLLLGLIVFQTGLLVDGARTWQLTKIYAPVFMILFIFINITYPDTVSFFIIGSVAVLSIFIYNLAIRKPSYIENTYNFLF